MDASGLRNFKDFLQLYNQMTERCFNRCIELTSSRQLNSSEIECVEKCATKFIKFNNKLMTHFVKNQSEIMTRRMKEIEQQQQILENSAEVVTSPHEVNLADS